jgi:hypothetical protein
VERLALRRAVLSHLQGSGFTHSGQTYWLYEKVRSAAVHGDGVPSPPGARDRTRGIPFAEPCPFRPRGGLPPTGCWLWLLVVYPEAFEDPRRGALDARQAGLGLLGAVEVQ